jgi:hypothetical protein
MRSLFVFSAVLAGMLLLSACGGDDRPPGTAGKDSTLVGGPCMNNSDCDEGLCQMGTDFPGGVCTLSCGGSGSCPSGSSCAESGRGWICLVDCTAATDCREQWTCQPIIEAGTNQQGMKTVCLGSAPAP